MAKATTSLKKRLNTGHTRSGSAPDIGETAMWRLLEGMTRAQAVILHELLMRSRKGLPS